MASVQPYLIFSGTCEEAVKFYCDVFGGEVQFSSRYKEGPKEMGVPAHWQEKILHCNFLLRGDQIMASDTQPGVEAVMGNNNIHLSVNFSKNEKMDDLFTSLSQGGRVAQDLSDTFWGARFGMLVDRCGVHWMFNQAQ